RPRLAKPRRGSPRGCVGSRNRPERSRREQTIFRQGQGPHRCRRTSRQKLTREVNQKMHCRGFVSCGAVIATVILGAPRADVTGVVFNDLNGNGARDPNEPGIAGVAVSNQDTVVTTDASGAFRMTSAGSGVLFVSTPDSYRSVGRFWRPVTATPLAFPLVRTAPRAEFTFVHASDLHISQQS